MEFDFDAIADFYLYLITIIPKCQLYSYQISGSPMNFLDAAQQILEEASQPLHYTEITRRALINNLISPKGQTPAATMGSRLYVDTKKSSSRFERAKKGFFRLIERNKTDEIAKSVNVINQATSEQLHKLLHDMPPDRFEALIGELLLALGFEENSIEVTQYSNDGGIDVRGILNAGGLTRINAAVQVKKWKRNIQVRTVRNVRGSLTAHEQGIIITTSNFSKGAISEANAIGKTPISLINGEKLLDLLFEHRIGVNQDEHIVYSLDEEWWGELIGSPITLESLGTISGNAKISIDFPLNIQAGNNPTLIGKLLNRKGQVQFSGKRYSSPSGAGKVASGWKSCNGWIYWHYQDEESGEWRSIQELRRKI